MIFRISNVLTCLVEYIGGPCGPIENATMESYHHYRKYQEFTNKKVKCS